MECRGWLQEAALRCLRNNLHPDVAERPQDLVVYGGSGKAARDQASLEAIERTLMRLADDETLLVQSGKPVAVFRTFEHAPRVLIANSLLVPAWATWDEFWRLEALGLTMYGQMTAGSWIYIGTQGIVQGTYQTFAAIAEQRYDGTLRGRIVLTAGLGGMGGAQPLAVTMNGGVALCVEVDPARAQRRLETRYLDEIADSLDDGLRRARRSGGRRPGALDRASSAMRPTSFPELLARGESMDIVTDQTSAHDPLHGYVPAGMSLEEAVELRGAKPEEYVERARASMVEHCRAMVGFSRAGAEVFDYGNALRAEARKGGLQEAFEYPGFVPCLYPAAVLRRGRAVPVRGAVRGSGGYRRRRRGAARSLPGQPVRAAVDPAGPGTSGLSRTSGPDLLARIRRAGQGRRGAQRPRRVRPDLGADRDRP